MRWSIVPAALVLVLSSAAVVQSYPVAAGAAPVPTEAFSAQGAFAAALRSGKPVEILSEKDSTTRAWANPSGRITAEIHGAPVRLKREGRWLDYDMTLVRRPDGTIAPRVHPDDLVLAGSAGAGQHDLATVLVHGERVGLGWNAALPEPVLDGAKATYPEAMPGVDLVLEARTSGFEQFFVVKDRAAAARVTGLRLPMRQGRHVFAAEGAGAGRWLSPDGQVIARMPEALMWDAQGVGPSGERKRQAKVGVSLRGARAAEAELGVDLGWLNDAATKYPVTIDPGIVVDRPVGFDEYAQNTIDISDNQSKDELKLGYSDDSTCVEASASQKCRTRSYLRFDGLSGYKNVKMYSARLFLWETHSWSCTQFGWRATRTDNATGSLQWGNEPAWREDAGSTTETKGWGTGCADGWVDTDVAPILDDTFAAGSSSASMVIHAVGDNSRDSWSLTDHNSWKKFDSMEGAHKPYIHLEYDHIPVLSNVQLEGDGSCGAGMGFRKYLALSNTNPRFTAQIKDDDKSPLPSYNVRLEVKATPIGGGTVLTGSSLNSAPNGGAIEVRLSQPLDPTKAYTYQLRGMDLYGDGTAMEYTPWSLPCELGFDSATLVSPPVVSGIPTLLVDEDGDGTPETPYYILNHATSAQLTFAPGAGDAGKVAAYRWGFNQSAIESPNAPTVPAGPDGSATIPVTRWEMDSQGFPTGDSQLYVRAVTITGAQFSTNVIQVWQDPEAAIPPVTHVRGDVNGDGAADHAGYRELSATEGLFYSYFGRNDGTLSSPAQLMKAPYTNTNSRVAQGDFSGDGKADFAVFVADGANDVKLKALTSDGNGLKDVEVWSSKLAGAANLGKWSLTAMRILSGDVNADGLDDLVVAYPNGTTSWMLKVFVATVVNGQLDFLDPANWLAAPAAYDISKVKLVIGQFDDQPGMDIAEFKDLGTCRTGLYLRESLTSGGVPTGQFHAGHLVWDSIDPSTWCLTSSQFISGKYGTSGTTGIVAFYDTGGCSNKVYTFTVEYISGAPRWFSNVLQETLGDITVNTIWCSQYMEPTLRDLTGGGREDLVVAYRCCGPYQQRVWMLRDYAPTYTTMFIHRPPSPPMLIYIEGRAIFKAPETVAQGGLSPIGVGGVKIDHDARYQVVAKHSNKCVAVFDGVNGGSTAEGAAIQQRTCVAGYLNEQFTLENLDASHTRLHPLHDPAKCLNVSGASTANSVPIVQNTCDVGQAKEFWQVEYLAGLSQTPGDPNEVTVRLVSNLSGKCLDVKTASVSDGAVLQQYACTQGQAHQQFFLRKVPATSDGLLAHWAMNSFTFFNQTLGDATGRNASASISGISKFNNQNNNYLVLDGTSGYARTSGPVINTTSSFTVSAWVRLNAVTGFQTVVAQESGTYCAFYLGLNPEGKWQLQLLNNIDGSSYVANRAISTTAAASGAWVHLVGVYDTLNAYTGRLYVNGVLEATVDASDRVAPSGPLVIGAAWSAGARVDHVGGAINDVRAWERVLSDAEVAQLYAAGAS